MDKFVRTKIKKLFAYIVFFDIFHRFGAATSLRKDNYYGSPLVLDALCENREQYISVFTLPEERLIVRGRPSDISDQLLNVNPTGMCNSISEFFF